MRDKYIKLFVSFGLFLIIIFFSKVLFKPCSFFVQDIMYQFHPYRVFASENIQKGIMPLWNPYIYSGMPFLANLQSAIFYPGTILFYIFDFPLAYKVFTVLNLFLGGYFFVLLMKSFYKKKLPSNIGILVSAIVFMFNGFLITKLQFLSIFGTVIWAPLALLFFIKCLKNKIFILFVSWVLSYQFFSGHTQYLIYTIIILLLYSLFYIYLCGKIHDKKKLIRKIIIIFGLSGFFSLIFSFVQFLPSFEFLNLSVRGGEGFDFNLASIWSLPPKQLLTAIFPFWFGNPIGGTYVGEGHFWTTCFYLGIIPAFFSIFYLFFNRNKKKIRFFCFYLICSLILSFGYYTPLYYFLYKYFFLLHMIRYPATFIFLAVFFISMISGIGMDYTLKYMAKFFNVFKKTWLKIGIVVLIVVDLFLFGISQNPILREFFFSQKGEKTDFLMRDNNFFRFFLTPNVSEARKEYGTNVLMAWIKLKDNLYSNINMPFHLFNLGGQDIMIRYYAEFLDAIIYSSSLEKIDKLFNLSNVKYVFSPLLKKTDYKNVKEGDMSVYQNTDFLPRIFISKKAKLLSKGEILKYLSSYNFDPANEVVIEEPVLEHMTTDHFNGGSNSGNNVFIVEYALDEVDVNASLEKSSWLVFSDTYYPGWKVYVNGIKDKIYKANYCFRAVYLDKGASTVKFVYKAPVAFKLGLCVTVFSIVLFLIKINQKVYVLCKDR